MPSAYFTMDRLPRPSGMAKKRGRRQRRRSICGESLSEASAVALHDARPVFAKTAGQAAALRAALSGAPLLRHLPPEQLGMAVDAAQLRRYAGGATIVERGALGSHMYVVESGAVALRGAGAGAGAAAEVALPGRRLCELAILYPAPSEEEAVAAEGGAAVWSLERVAFKGIVVGAEVRRRQLRATLARRVCELTGAGAGGAGGAGPLELPALMACNFTTSSFAAGDEVGAGADASAFFVIESGTAEAEGEGGARLRLEQGGYCGVLTRGAPPAVGNATGVLAGALTVRALTPLRCVRLAPGAAAEVVAAWKGGRGGGAAAGGGGSMVPPPPRPGGADAFAMGDMAAILDELAGLDAMAL